jgi:hypothetical protein
MFTSLTRGIQRNNQPYPVMTKKFPRDGSDFANGRRNKKGAIARAFSYLLYGFVAARGYCVDVVERCLTDVDVSAVLWSRVAACTPASSFSALRAETWRLPLIFGPPQRPIART